jgi:SAM-dependent methyltransferase
VSTAYPGKELEAMSFAVNYHRWIVDEIKPFLGRTVAEVGAGIGDLSSLLIAAGVERLFAFEPSSNLYPTLAPRLEKEPGATAINGFFDPGLLPDRVDAACYINVLEHIEDDLGELRTAADAIRPDGHLLIFVPALSWLYSHVDREVGHFRRYARRELLERVTGCGFEPVRARYFDIAGILPWYVNFVLLKRPLAAGNVRAYDRLVVPPMRRLERWIKPPIGKNLLLVARRP